MSARPNKLQLIIVGSIATDTLKTPHGKVVHALGGSAMYASVAASYFCHVGVVGVVGKDFARRHRALFSQRRIDVSGLQVHPTEKTFHWQGYYEDDMNQAHTVKTELNAFASFSPAIPEEYRTAPHLLLGNIHPSLQLEVLEQVRKPRVVLCDTMNYWITSEPKLLEQVFRRVDVICINDAEARQFCNTPSLPAAAAELLKLGPSRVIIKMGSAGCLLFGGKTFFSLPALPLAKVKDPTGAGDSFAGGIMGCLSKARTVSDTAVRRALVAGTVLASICVEDFSCQKTRNIKPGLIRSRASQLRKATQVPSFTCA